MLPPVVGSGVIVQAGGAWLLPPSVPSVVVGVVVVLGGARLLPPFDVTGASGGHRQPQSRPPIK